jgi:hypothetical protein
MPTPSEWVEADLNALVNNKIGEDVNLEYKACASLQQNENSKDELSRDVSALANSAGGTIVYGMIEDQNTHLPTGLDSGYDPSVISKEWLENVIHSRIKPKVEGLHINPVQLTGSNAGKVAYVVSIPQGTTAHQASDKKYYKRYNFKREAMEDYEIRDVMNRLKYPLLLPRFAARFVERSGAVYEYALLTWLRNDGAMCAREIKLALTIPAKMRKRATGFKERSLEIESPLFGRAWFKNSINIHGRALFPDDEVLISELTAYDFVYLVDTSKYDLNEQREPFLLWKIFADDMPPQSGEVFLSRVPKM